ncbi:MAG: hypothetical protein AAGI54_04170 [Planctomycetota bacterium]
MSVADFQADIAATRTHIGNADWDAAETSAMQGLAAVAAVPDAEAGSEKVAFARQTLTDLLDLIRRKRGVAANSGKGVVRTNVNYQRPGLSLETA